MNRDTMTNASPARVAKATMSLLDRLQRFQPGDQVLAAAAVFLTLAEHWGIPAQDAFTIIKNLMIANEGKRHEFRALDAYIKNELR